VSHTRNTGRTVLAVAGLSLLALLLAACGRGEAVANNQGNDAFETGDLEAALQGYEEVQELAPERPEPFYNSASVRYRNEEHDLAQEDLQQALLTADDDLTRATLFNQGNSFFEIEDLGQAVESYKEVLRMDPDDQDAKYNLELALAQMEQQQQQGEEQDQELEEPPGDTQQQEQEDGEGETGDQPDEEQEGDGEPSDQPEPGEGEQAEPEEEGQDEPAPGDVQETEISEEQAEQLLDSIGRTTETLQNALQRTVVLIGDVPEKDW
jgi:Ca-activated chloride channel family protein